MNFCSHCGSSVRPFIPQGDDRERHVCSDCGLIHYQNPKVVVGCIAEWQEKVILCTRAIAPRIGYWTLPAGYLENDETTEQGAAREAREEAGIEARITALHGIYELPHINQLYLFYRAELLEPEFAPGVESLDVRLISEAEVPWSELAFGVVGTALKSYFNDRRNGAYQLHRTTVQPGAI
ncbi:MAG: NUDIX hydrolase [Gammaproteobacteria bacterium]|nr:NUDIX hydrolase [Gammaproteobacteria bacterium]